MSEPDISTLARRLAEQNNVDWRSLSGSGPEGKVVERDVLDYLARVMAGSEALDPTPEPLPDGMEAWPDQGLADFRQGVSASAAGMSALQVETGEAVGASYEDDAIVAVSDVDAETVTFGAGSTSGAFDGGTDDSSVDMVSEDIFLFDDEEASGDEAETAGVMSSGALSTSDMSTSDMGIDDIGTGDMGTGDIDPDGIDTGDELDDLLVAGDDGVLAGGGDAFEDGFEGETLSADSFSQVGDLSDATSTEEFGADFATGFGNVQSEETGELGDFSVAGSGFGGGDVEPEEDLPDLFGEPEEIAEPVGQSFVAADEELFESEVAGAFASEDSAFAFDEAVDEPASEALEVTAGEAVDIEPETAFTASTDAEPEVGFVADGSVGLEPEIVESVPYHSDTFSTDVDSPVAIEAAALPLARTGSLLRRVVDLSSLASAQLAVSQELGNAEPLSAAPFLLRAVAKAAAETGVVSGPVALAELGDGVRLRRVDSADTRSFGSLVSALDGEFSEEDEPGIAVADLGPLDLDEVILDLQMPVVSLGRVLYDTQRGGSRSTLTLSGPVQPDSGARLLARVAELLDAPVRLVL